MSVIGEDTVLGIVGGMATLEFTITDASPSVDIGDITWLFDNGFSITDITGSNANGLSFSSNLLQLVITIVSNSHEGNYTLIASNAAGSNENTIFLEVEGMHNIYSTVKPLYSGHPEIRTPLY